jgi:hypothetical protein
MLEKEQSNMSTQTKANETAANSDNVFDSSGRVVRHERKGDEAGNVTHYVEIRQKATADEKDAPSYLFTARGEASDKMCEGIKEGDYVEATACVSYSGEYTAAFELLSIKKVGKLKELVNRFKLAGKIGCDNDEGKIVKVVSFRAGGKHGLLAIVQGEKSYIVRFHGENAIENAEKLTSGEEVEVEGKVGVRYYTVTKGPKKGRRKKSVELIVDSVRQVNAQDASEETEETPETAATE